MSLVYVDRVKQNATVQGVANIILASPIATYNQFVNSNLGANVFPYVVINNLQFEVGIGSYVTPSSSGSVYGTITRSLILSTSTGDAQPVVFNGSAAIVAITNPSELSVLVSSTPVSNSNKLVKWTGSQYDLIDPIENGPALGASIGSSLVFYNYFTTNFDADPSLKWLPGAVPELYVQGVIQATAKAFKIPHPTKPGWLQHGCLEGPEYGIYFRGSAKIRYNVEIFLPDYFQSLTSEEYTVHISSNTFIPVKTIKKNKSIILKLLFPSINIIEIDYCIISNRTDVEFKLEV